MPYIGDLLQEEVLEMASFEWPAFLDSFPILLRGAALTVWLSCAIMAISIVVGLLLALLRLSRYAALRGVTMVWVEIWRATPLLLQLFWLFYVMPSIFHITLPPITTALIGFSGNISAFLSETFRAGIVSIRTQQRHAALALGMRPFQAFRYVVAPQAFSRILPAFANTWISLFKDTSLVSTIAVADLAYVGLQLRESTFRTLEILTAMALLYLAMAYPQTKLVDWLERRRTVRE